MKIGNTSLRPNGKMGLGCMPLQYIEEDEGTEFIRQAYEEGINFFDTARGYSMAEKMVGLGLKDVHRTNYFLGTKTYGRTKEEISKDYFKSLNELQTSFIDLYQLHTVKSRQELTDEVLNFLDKKKGYWYDNLGFTIHHREEEARKILDTGIFDTIMIPYNYIERESEPLIDYCNENGIGVLIMKPSADGRLYAPIALKWLARRYKSFFTLVGTTSISHLKDDIQIFKERAKLNKSDKVQIEKTKYGFGKLCRRCDRCVEACPNGVKPTWVIQMTWILIHYGEEAYDEKKEKILKDAVTKCENCGECKKACEYGALDELGTTISNLAEEILKHAIGKYNR